MKRVTVLTCAAVLALATGCGSGGATGGNSADKPVNAVCAAQSAPIFTRIIVAGHYAQTVCADIAPGGNQSSTMILDGVDDPFTSSSTSVPANYHLACTVHRLDTTWWIETGGSPSPLSTMTPPCWLGASPP